jgi:hypothetical protein
VAAVLGQPVVSLSTTPEFIFPDVAASQSNILPSKTAPDGQSHNQLRLLSIPRG